jgi:hypothetical protein
MTNVGRDARSDSASADGRLMQGVSLGRLGWRGVTQGTSLRNEHLG